MAILQMKHISKQFSGVYVNKDISLSLEPGEIHALLGENGAGKTTLMNVLFGIYHADHGEMEINGKTFAPKSPKDAIAAGLGMVFQHFSLVKNMTVVDNMMLGLEQNTTFLSRKACCEKIKAISEKYGLAVNPTAKVSDLSVGQCQRVEILKTLYRDAQCIILDEPTAVLTPRETKDFFQVLRQLAAEGKGIIIITHKMSEIMAISHRVSVLRDGEKVVELVTAHTDPAELSRHMLGRPLQEGYSLGDTSNTLDSALLQVEHLTYAPSRRSVNLLTDVHFSLMPGEILGVAGVEGSGQKELCEILTGLRHQTAGHVHFCGETVDKLSVKQRFQKGLSYISDDRNHDGLVGDMSVSENLILRQYNQMPFSKYGFWKKGAIEQVSLDAIAQYQIKTSGKTGRHTATKMLSGGNQQKVIISREIHDHSKLVIACQPTRGLDMGATEAVRNRLVEHRNQGNGVLLVSADLEEILLISDRVAVMEGGKILNILSRDEANIETIGMLMGGIAQEDA